ncbi:MAG: hypothetical protein ACYTG0_20755 [Planctomycetota bacterium]
MEDESEHGHASVAMAPSAREDLFTFRPSHVGVQYVVVFTNAAPSPSQEIYHRTVY